MKIKNLNVLILFLLSFLTFTKSWSQYSNLEFDHYTINDGLSNGYVTSILQDSKGFIWIGTGNGLNCFDGLSFKSYFYNPNDTNSIPDNTIAYITEDTLNRILVFTSTGLCMFDRKKDRFIRKKIRVNGQLIENININACLIDKKGFLWTGAYNGIFKFKLYNNPQISNGIIDAQQYTLDEKDIDKIFQNQVNSLIEDENGIIWAASFSNKLFYFAVQHHKFLSYEINHTETNSFSKKKKGMIKDRDGNFFVTIERVGLLVWDRKNDNFNLYKPGPNTGLNGQILYPLAEDKNGGIWVGDIEAGGINIFNKKTKEFINILSDGSNPNSLISNKVSFIYRDKSGSMWVGANVGIDRYSNNRIKFSRYFSSTKRADKLSLNNTLCFTESKKGDIWIGTDGGGLNKLNRHTGKFTHYLHDPAKSNSISSNAIISLCEDHEGTLWIGTFNGGLVRMKNNKFSAFYNDPSNPYSIAQNHAWYVLEDSKNNLWLATLNLGLELFDRKTNRFYQYTSKEDSTLCNNSILQLYEDSRQKLYMTTYGGVSIIDLNSVDFSTNPPILKFQKLQHDEKKNSLSSNAVYCVSEDNEKNLWFGTFATGMDKLDMITGKFTNYSIRDGLPGNAVTSILFDDDNNAWVATNKGLVKFNTKTKESHVFDQQDGLQNKSLKGWSVKTKDGEMFFGGSDGFNSFYPNKISYNKNIPPVIMTGLKIYNQPVKVDEKINGKIILTEDISATSKLVLSHNENFLTFEFIALDFTAPKKNKYAFMMEGVDKEWVFCGTKREANYTNLDPGKYTFRVKASNNDGVWNETGTSINIIILPPWWQAWWFRIIIILILIASIYLAYYLRVEAYRQKQRELSILVKLRTQEISQANKKLLERQTRIEEYAREVTDQSNELKTINKQLEEQSEELQVHTENLKGANELLIEKQKLIEAQTKIMTETNEELTKLNATKDKLFSIIGHDLRNPFNSIIGFSELLVQRIEQLPLEKTKKYLSLIYNVSSSGYELLNNLLQWSHSQTGRITFEPDYIFPAQIVTEVINLVEGSAQSKNISFQQLIDPDFIIYADENMLQTIFRNLISNAIKFSYQNSEIIIASTSSDNKAEISVKDSGVGIPVENLKQLFDVSSNIITQGTSNETGTGLGLIICKEFVERHNGTIWAESQEGKGTEFKFTLPIA